LELDSGGFGQVVVFVVGQNWEGIEIALAARSGQSILDIANQCESYLIATPSAWGENVASNKSDFVRQAVASMTDAVNPAARHFFPGLELLCHHGLSRE